MTAGVHDATAAEAATQTEGIALPSVDVDACTTANADHVSADVVSTSDRREDRQAVVEASIGRPVVTILRKPLRYILLQIDSSLQTLGRFFDLAAEAFVFLLTDLIRLRHPWRDTINQAWFIVSVTAIPALLVSA